MLGTAHRMIGRFLATFGLLLISVQAEAARFQLDIGGEGDGHEGSAAIKMMVILTLLSLAPAMLLTMTSFVRISVVLMLLRTALGTQTSPPQQALMGLSLFLTVAIMWPVGSEMYERGLQPYMEDKISSSDALVEASKPLRIFMLRQTREKDLKLFYELSQTAKPKAVEEVGMHLLIPAFVISELRTAFEMGFLVYIPFLLLDMVVASVTMSLGLVMLPPALLSLPLKIMLFVLSDGWNLIVRSLVRSFG
ncbi:MAG: flagellar type III secretion system pore protein FliP [Myxococcota bacterium]|nr:flagellar type III secretion system pore protein FliP [Myxococcota bacterium]